MTHICGTRGRWDKLWKYKTIRELSTTCRPKPIFRWTPFKTFCATPFVSDVILRHISWSILARVMAWCHQAPSHYLKQCWLTISGFSSIHMRTISQEILLMSICKTWWRHQMEVFSALLALCAGNSLVAGEFPAKRLVTRSFDVFFDLRPE